MVGMNRHDGAPIDGIEDIRQSIHDILTTPVGSRLARRTYGSLLPEMIDRPLIPANVLRLYAATALAISRWEDRVRLRRVSIDSATAQGGAVLIAEGDRIDLPTAQPFRLAIPLSL
ncbi:GPW/gp25 family protein [Sphingobium cloacae]|uniref:Phage-related baseplate protein n=1 Tax=Sphingobium cloacae TaxID=120107 RepID=A0A1E1F5F7_9SPHN|nr:GPW/gp25 family protein [Sphingobium cloacae]BAV65753.1 phage-related baseplate protein [Sphingobium cloacae]